MPSSKTSKPAYRPINPASFTQSPALYQLRRYEPIANVTSAHMLGRDMLTARLESGSRPLLKEALFFPLGAGVIDKSHTAGFLGTKRACCV
jgi:hypothetical protein